MNVRCVGVVGGGHHGAGHRHHLRRRRPRRPAARPLARAHRGTPSTCIGETLDRDIAKWRRTAAEKKAIQARVQRGGRPGRRWRRRSSWSRRCPEDLELKTAIFQELDRVCPPEDILATNTSALSVTRDRGPHEAARPRDRPALPGPGAHGAPGRGRARAEHVGRDLRGTRSTSSASSARPASRCSSTRATSPPA